MKNEVLIVLGAPNSPSGELGEISISRLDCCLALYSKGKKILCTGGWGEHFNTSEDAHATHAKKYLIEKGVLESDFLDFALSSNTVEDAVKVKEIISGIDSPHLIVITSVYHYERVKLIFQEVLTTFKVNIVAIQCDINKDQLHGVLAHEQKAIESIVENGLYY